MFKFRPPAPKQAVDDRARHAAHRVRLLNEEVDRLRLDATDRAKSVDAKSSFLAVSSGIVITASTSQFWTVPWMLALLPLALASIALGFATYALRPGKRSDLSPELLWLEWRDSEKNIAVVEDSILRAKVFASKMRELEVTRRASVTSAGFVVLVGSALSLVILFAAELAL